MSSDKNTGLFLHTFVVTETCVAQSSRVFFVRGFGCALFIFREDGYQNENKNETNLICAFGIAYAVRRTACDGICGRKNEPARLSHI